jgi:hypothetical protein
MATRALNFLDRFASPKLSRRGTEVWDQIPPQFFFFLLSFFKKMVFSLLALETTPPPHAITNNQATRSLGSLNTQNSAK